MIIVIEGPRGVGKTAIANALVKRLTDLDVPARYVKFQRGGNPVYDMLTSIEEMDATPSTVFVIDRFHLTEWVMRTFDKTIPEEELYVGLSLVDQALGSDGAAVVYVQATAFARELRIARRKDGRGIEMPSKISDHLWELACKRFWIDYMFDNELDGDVEKIVKFLTTVSLNALKERV